MKITKKARRQEVTKSSLKDFLLFGLFVFFILLTAHCSLLSAFAADKVLTAGVSIDKIPADFYGTWRVSAKLQSTNSDSLFKSSSVDLWNLSRVGDVITLDNPFSGAKASITVNSISGRAIKFRKTGDYDSKKLTDTVQMMLGKDTFVGTNTLKFDTISGIDGHIVKTEWATYSLKGEKISGENIKN